MSRDPIYTIADMAKATGLSASTIRSWYQRGHINLGEDDTDALKNGQARLFTARTVVLVGVFSALTQMGVAAPKAEECARRFAYFGVDGREPAGLFPNARDTVLIVYPREKSFCQIVPWRAVGDVEQAMSEGLSQKSEIEGVQVLLMTTIVWRIREALGLPREAEGE